MKLKMRADFSLKIHQKRLAAGHQDPLAGGEGLAAPYPKPHLLSARASSPPFVGKMSLQHKLALTPLGRQGEMRAGRERGMEREGGKSRPHGHF